jgi:formylglycine-generating enzyme required for sulfatase activity
MIKQANGNFLRIINICWYLTFFVILTLIFPYTKYGQHFSKEVVYGFYTALKYILILDIFCSIANWVYRVVVLKIASFLSSSSGIWNVIIFTFGFLLYLILPVHNPSVPSARSNMVFVPAANFLLGSNKEGDSKAMDNELPQFTIYLNAFWIDKTEVTNAMYASCVAAGSCRIPAWTNSATKPIYYDDDLYADYPVIWVEWSQAWDYCHWAGKRLPTEAEWEKAARGTDGRIYPWGNQAPTCNLANSTIKYVGCVGDASKVGSFPAGASPYGALDMAGNVREWVEDYYRPNRSSNSPAKKPAESAPGKDRVVRGGSWLDNDQSVRAAYRAGVKPDLYDQFTGFRCATSP